MLLEAFWLGFSVPIQTSWPSQVPGKYWELVGHLNVVLQAKPKHVNQRSGLIVVEKNEGTYVESAKRKEKFSKHLKIIQIIMKSDLY